MKLASLLAATFALAAPAFPQISPTTNQLQSSTDLAPWNGPAHDVSTTPNGLYSITSSNLGQVGVAMIELASGAIVGTHDGPGTHTAGNNTMTRSVLTTDTRAVVVGISGTVNIYDISGGTLTLISSDVQPHGAGAQAKDMAITPDGTRAVVVFSGDDTLVYDLDVGGPAVATNGPLTGPGTSYGTVPALNALRVSNTHAVAIGTRIRIYDLEPTQPSDITPSTISSLPSETYYDVEMSPSGTRAFVRADNSTGADDSHSISLFNAWGQNAAWHEGAFPNPGSVDVYSAGRLRGLLEDSLVMTDDKVMVLGINSLSSSTVQVIDYPTSGPVLNSFTMGGVGHDLEITEAGTRGIVHSSGEVQVFDLSVAGSPAKLGPALASPGSGMLNIQNISNGIWTVYYSENTVAINDTRAVVIGSNYNPAFGTGSSNINVYDLAVGGGTPALVQGHNNSSTGTDYILHEVAITPSGGMAGVSSSYDAAFVDMDSGSIVSVNSSAGRISTFTVHSLSMSNTHTTVIGNNSIGLTTYRPRYSVFQTSQLPYNQGTPLPNTTGVPTLLSATGSLSHAANNLSLVATGIPTTGGVPQSQGLMFYSFGLNGPTPLNDGLLFIGPALFRVTPNPVPITTDPYVLPVDLSALPAGGPIGAFQEVHFQLWYRDNASPNGANLSDVLTISYGL